MSQGLVTASYIVAAVLFILSLAGLSKQETAKHGNLFGIAGMAIALLATVFNPETSGVHWIILAMVIGGAIGVRLALKVEMTEMPELVAVLHSFVGMAAVLVGFNSFIDLHPSAPAEVVVSVGSNLDATLAAARAAFEQAASVAQVEHLAGAMLNIHLVEVFLGVFIGAVTFTGSVVAFGKLRGLISSKPLQLPHRHKLNLLAVVVSLALMIHFVNAGGSTFALLVMTMIVGGNEKAHEHAIRASELDTGRNIAFAIGALLFVLAHASLEAGRGWLAADGRLRSALKAWWRGLKLLCKRPFAVLSVYVGGTLPSLLLAAALLLLRPHIGHGGVGALFLLHLLSRRLSAARGWGGPSRFIARHFYTHNTQ